MFLYESLKEKVKDYLTPNRYEHSLGVVEAATRLAEEYQIDIHKAKIAALVHDCAKGMDGEQLLKIAIQNNLKVDDIVKTQQELLHGPVGSIVAQKDLGIDDPEILRAIEFHTTGKINMTKLEKIIYLADYIEPGRNFPGVDELRKKAKRDLEEALLQAFDNTIQYVIKKHNLIHPNTIEARNDILRKIYYNKEKQE